MSRPQSPASVGASPLKRKRQEGRRYKIRRLKAEMACETAFRDVARGCLEDLTANREAAGNSDREGLHQMRVALTRLRTAISFFSPMVTDPKSARLKRELRWLNARLGPTRDLDVAIKRSRKNNKHQPANSNGDALTRKWADSHRRLTRTLRSARYRQLVKSTRRWVENGPWSTASGKQAAKRRAFPIASYSAPKLARWNRKLLKKSRKLEDIRAKKRHRLRLLTKKLRYATEFFGGLFPNGDSSGQQAALKHLNRAQDTLGKLNDAISGQSLAAALEPTSAKPHLQVLSRKHERRLLRAATAAYRQLAGLKPIW
jgi:CHAD domain-containing protein